MEKQEKGTEFTQSPCLEYAFNYSMVENEGEVALARGSGEAGGSDLEQSSKIHQSKEAGDQMGQRPCGATGLAEGVQRASSTQTARPRPRTGEAGKVNGSQSTQRSSVISALRRQGQEYSLKSGPS